jgi:hypothetical protein
MQYKVLCFVMGALKSLKTLGVFFIFTETLTL